MELEAYNRAERKHMDSDGFLRASSENRMESTGENSGLQKDLDSLKKVVADLASTMKAWEAKAASDVTQRGGTRPESRQTSWNTNKRKCFLCGSDKHLQPKCPRNKSYGKSQNKHAHKSQAKHVAATGSGLYTDCKINGVAAECLIDTGASLTILSKKAMEIISQNSKIQLEPFHSKLFTASGEKVSVHGKTRVLLELCGQQSIIDVTIADIDIDVIIGLDFLKENECQLDLVNNILNCRGKQCVLRLMGKLGCYRVTVAEKIEVPARSEVIIEGTRGP